MKASTASSRNVHHQHSRGSLGQNLELRIWVGDMPERDLGISLELAELWTPGHLAELPSGA